jgi:hypothetical protein
MNTTASTNNNVATIESKKPANKQELIATNIKLLIEQLAPRISSFITATLRCWRNRWKIQQTASVILAALGPLIADEVTNEQLAEGAA